VKIFGRTPKAEILRTQLDRVRRLLAETDLPLKQIASKTGFQYPEYMSTAFKERTGQTPGQYRRSSQQRA
jgi:LacI family transcriptional regulator